MEGRMADPGAGAVPYLLGPLPAVDFCSEVICSRQN